jgi:hypothetical protein
MRIDQSLRSVTNRTSRVKGTLVALSVVSAGIVAVPPPAAAEEIDCPPRIIKRTVDNVYVNGTCTIRLSRIEGNIVVGPNGNLLVKGSTIVGNVQSDGAGRIRLLPDATTGRETIVNGSIQIKNTAAGLTSIIQDVRVGGSIQIENNAGPFNLFGNDVNADVQVFQNTAVVRIRDNTIDGNLQCKENAPRPLNGGGNVVGGNAEDQCAGFDR